jgi:hypothetical protein
MSTPFNLLAHQGPLQFQWTKPIGSLDNDQECEVIYPARVVWMDVKVDKEIQIHVLITVEEDGITFKRVIFAKPDGTVIDYRRQGLVRPFRQPPKKHQGFMVISEPQYDRHGTGDYSCHTSAAFRYLSDAQKQKLGRPIPSSKWSGLKASTSRRSHER